ncbi:MAG TPA: elongation factor P [Myxococcota bacterium]|jgi:elongation factor P|nr:elongation factor P [Myxococcota bacterium]
MIQANQVKVGHKIVYNGDPCRVAAVTHMTPGNLRGFVRIKMRNLRTGMMLENKFGSTDRIDQAQLDTHTMQYLYRDGDDLHFMNTETYEQTQLPADALGDSIGYLLDNMNINVEFYDGKPVGVELPATVDLKIIDTSPPLKGATAAASPKPAKVETGITVTVPQFLTTGEVVRIDTITGEYLERVKK